MQKGYKRTGKAIAVLHFFIGLILVAIFLIAAYFFLEKMDYSHRINPDTTVRPYVEMTASPDDFGAGAVDPMSDPNEFVDLVPTATPTVEPTQNTTATPEPTSIPTPSPEPTATPEPTPEPTAIPKDRLSQFRTDGFSVPAPAEDATTAITNIYVSEPNDNNYVQIAGYCYVDDPSFDAKNESVFLIVSREGSTQQVAYMANMTPGISGVSHEGAKCANPENADFEVVLSVTGFSDGEYKLGAVLMYDNNGQSAYSYYEFDQTLTVKGEAAVQPTQAFISAETDAATAEAEVEAVAEIDGDEAAGDADADFADVTPEPAADGATVSVG